MIADPTALGACSLALEKLIDGALRYDPGTRAALAGMAGKVLALESTFPPLTLYLAPQPADADVALAVHAFWEGQPDTTLRGALPAMLALAFGAQHSLAGSGVKVSGSTQVLSQFQDIMQHLDIDWEEPLTAVLGNTLGHPIAQLLRGQIAGFTARADKAQQFTGDYLTEELRAVVGKPELEAFYRDVDDLRSAADRLSAKIQKLYQQLQSQEV